MPARRARGPRHLLTHTQVVTARPGTTIRKLFDGGGLYLAVLPSGVRSWRLKFSLNGRERLATLGKFPTVTLPMARERAEAARRELEAGRDPVQVHKATHKARATEATAPTFEDLAREWHALMCPQWVERHQRNVLACLERDVFPVLGREPVGEITSKQVLDILMPIAARSAADTAARVQQRLRAVFDHATATGRANGNPAAVRFKVLPRNRNGKFARVPLDELPKAMRQLAGGNCGIDLNVRLALRFLILTAARSGEVRGATWNEIDRKAKLWKVPAERMKKRREHWVPLTPQALAVLEEARIIATGGELIFPSLMTRGPLSDVVLSKALHRITTAGVPHGVRHTFSTWGHDAGHDSRAIELCLAHVDSNKVRGIYDASERLTERRRLLTRWSTVVCGDDRDRPAGRHGTHRLRDGSPPGGVDHQSTASARRR